MLTFLRPYLFWPRCHCGELHCLRLAATRKVLRSRKYIAHSSVPAINSNGLKCFTTSAVSREKGRGSIEKMLTATRSFTAGFYEPKKPKQGHTAGGLSVQDEYNYGLLRAQRKIERERKKRGLSRQGGNRQKGDKLLQADASTRHNEVGRPPTSVPPGSSKPTQDPEPASRKSLPSNDAENFHVTDTFKPRNAMKYAHSTSTAKKEASEELPSLGRVTPTTMEGHELSSPSSQNDTVVSAPGIRLVKASSKWEDYTSMSIEPWNVPLWKQPKPAIKQVSTDETHSTLTKKDQTSDQPPAKATEVEFSNLDASNNIKRLEESAREMKELLESFFPTSNKPTKNGNGNGSNGKKIPWMDVSEAVRTSADDLRRVDLVKHEYVRQVFSDTLRTAEESKGKSSNGSRRDLILTNVGKTMLASDISRIAHYLNKQNLGRGVEKIIPIRDILYLDRRPAFAIITNSSDIRVNFQNMLKELESKNEHYNLTLPPTAKPSLRVRAIDGSTLVPSRLFDGGASPERCVRLVLSGCPHEIIRRTFEDTILRSSGLSRILLQNDLVPGTSVIALSSPEQDEVAHEGAWLVKFAEGYEAEAERLEREWHLKEIQVPFPGAGNGEQSYRVVVQAEVTRW